MLQFILGPSGSGKTSKAVNILTELCKKGNKKLLMLVPDQSSFETESTFLDILGAKHCREVMVFGFSRLCSYVFSTTGNIPQNVIDDGLRKIIMSKALDEVGDRLKMFGSANTRKSVIDLMIHSLQECKKDNITTLMLNNVTEHIDDDTLKQKLSETSIVLDAYDAIMSRTYVDPLDDLNRLKTLLEDTKMFQDYTIVADSFSGFTYQQLEIIDVLMRQSKYFYITLNIDYNDKDSEIFATTNRTRKAVKRIAINNGIKIMPNILLHKFYRSNREDILFLEKNILRINDIVYENMAQNIETFAATNIYKESEFVARRIKNLVVNKGYSYSDIAVVSRDSSKYEGILDTTFEKYEIPYFMDISKDIFTKSAVRFISCAIECILYNFDRDLLLSMLKTGLTSLPNTEIADFENYLFVWDLDGADLKKPFKDNPSGFEVMTDEDKDKLAEIENTRQFIIKPLQNFAECCKDTTGLEISKAIYNLLQEYKVENSINELYDSLNNQGFVFEANEEIRIYNMIMESLDKIVAVVGDSNISLKKYKEYLDYKLSDLKVSDIPRYQDQVAVGTADRVRVNNAKAVFVLGAIDGEFPSIPNTVGVFSENERRILIENDIPLTDSLEELACHEKYLAYCALTSCSEKLFVSFYVSDYSGNSFAPSVIFSEIKRIFPNHINSTSTDFNEFNELWSEQQAFELLAKNFQDNSPEVAALKSYFLNNNKYADLVFKIDKILKNKPFKIKNKETAEKLFSKNMSISASQLEKYNLCAFQYFCNYGLRAKERKTASIDAIQFGNIVHYFLEEFLKAHKKEILNQLSDEEIHNSINNILLKFADDALGGLEGKSSSFLFQFERLKKNIFTLIKQIIRQLQYSDFVPTDFELKIGSDGEIPPYKVEIDSNSSVSVNGFIDRVDIMEKNDRESYVRVVDYKTGNKVFKLYEILYGINMQMLIYLCSVTENGDKYFGKKLIPSGILYMPSATKDIDGDKNNSKEMITSQLDKNFQMNGLILNDSNVINHMDRNGKFIKYSKKLVDGKFSDSVATKEQFQYIFKHIDDTIRSMGKELLNGNIAAEPLKGIQNGCEYCPYDSVCCHKYGDKYKFRKEATPKEVYTKLGMEVNSEDE